MIQKILIANRGEIACRVIRTARDLGIATVAIYSDADAGALHVEMADEAVRIGPAPVADSYLKGDVIIAAAKTTGADAIHPGYGFLSENPDFVDAVTAAGLIFIGPSAEAIRAMGLKDRAKALMETAGVPVVPGYHGDSQDPDLLAAEAEKIGYPVLIKARAGGGGKGMRLVEDPADFTEALASAQREGQASFGDPACLIEKYIQSPRHIEVQVFGDTHGNVVHLYERDCSLQRRHQKVIEEAPAPGMTDDVRAAMGAAAVAAAKAVNYAGAGTVEFIVDGSGPLRTDGFWFMEMNTRLQVEHPVTERITGLDLVALQIAVAQGAPLPFEQSGVQITGHAFEARLYAEDAANGFLPATGTLDRLSFPASTGNVRIDTGVRQGDAITPHYDPMIAKVITHGPDRASALRLLDRALSETVVLGSVTNRAFLTRLSRDPDFAAGQVDTGLIGRKEASLVADPVPTACDFGLAALACILPEVAPVTGDPFADLPGFRVFGPARQGVVFAADPPYPVTVEWSGDRAVCQTPLGKVTFERPRRQAETLVAGDGDRRFEVRYAKIGDQVSIQRDGMTIALTLNVPGAGEDDDGGDAVLAPMPGLVQQVFVGAGHRVEKGERLAVLEAMKMEHGLLAPRDCTIAEVLAKPGDQVEQGALLLRLETDEG